MCGSSPAIATGLARSGACGHDTLVYSRVIDAPERSAGAAAMPWFSQRRSTVRPGKANVNSQSFKSSVAPRRYAAIEKPYYLFLRLAALREAPFALG
jgi:hypothetical protein